jgi:hypothetical protein
MLLAVTARVVHHAQVHDGLDRVLAEDVLHPVASDIDGMMFDVLRFTGKLAAIEAHYAHVPVQVTRDAAPQIAADAGHEHGIRPTGYRTRRPRGRAAFRR